MTVNNLEFFKNIISDNELKQYLQLIDCEKYQPQIEANQTINQGRELILTSCILTILTTIKSEQKNLKAEKMTLFWNQQVYKIKKIVNNLESDKDLLEAFELKNKSIFLEEECLKTLKKYLSNISKLENISTIYLYFISLLTLKDTINSYLNQCLVTNDSNSKNINATFYNDIDINNIETNIQTVSDYILKLKK